MPVLLAALEMAFTAVCIAFINCVRSPVAEAFLLCSANKNRVNVIQSVSIPLFVDILEKNNKNVALN